MKGQAGGLAVLEKYGREHFAQLGRHAKPHDLTLAEILARDSQIKNKEVGFRATNSQIHKRAVELVYQIVNANQ